MIVFCYVVDPQILEFDQFLWLLNFNLYR